MATAMTLDKITGGDVDAAYGLHKSLGPGRQESVYERICQFTPSKCCPIRVSA
jgi:hypothetical protein